MAWCAFIAFACMVAAGWIRLFFIIRRWLRKRGAQRLAALEREVEAELREGAE